MEGFKKNEPENLNKKHFATIHEKVRNKYEQIQKRLEKSRSLSSLTSLDDEFVFLETNGTEDIGENKNKAVIDEEPHNLVIEEIAHVTRQDADEVFITYTDIETSETEKKLEKFFESGDNISNRSLESLTEVPNENTENEEFLEPPTPPPRMSIRNKIGSRISAAKEKRRDKKKEALEKVEKLVLSNTIKQSTIKVPKKIKVATVTIALIEATGFERESIDEKSRMLLCRFRLGAEKYKSKTVKSNASPAKWQELFNINLYDENMLDISLWDRDIFLGRSNIDLSETKREKTHKMRLTVEGGATNAQLFILLTISGTSLDNIFLDFDEYCRQTKREEKFNWYHLRDDYTDVGSLYVIVYGAKGLSANDCYCVLELNNDRNQTHTEMKTHEPNWMKIFSFSVTDVTTILEVTIMDEKKSEDIGKVSIPLLRINNGEKKWYALKDSTQRERAKGNNPRILLELKLNWNLVKASLRVINPKEVKYMQTKDKLTRQKFASNLSRARAVFSWIFDAVKIIKTCFEWESRQSNLIALAIWLVMCWIFRVWMLPLLLLIPFVWYRPQKYYMYYWKHHIVELESTEIENDEKNEKEEKTSLRQKLSTLQDMVLSVQNFIGKLSSLGESIKNLFNFTTPFLSFFTIVILLAISFIMYIIPVKYIFMFWGIHKFTRKVLRPNRVPNNELLDLLSRVPDDETLLNCEELLLEETNDENIL